MRARALLAATLCAVVSIAACAHEARDESATLAKSPDSSWIGPELASFELVERSGAQATLAALGGQPFVLDFIFTTCSGPCPRMSAGMQALQARLADVDARLVSVSVDPRRDTPDVLREYANRFGADPQRWWMLTGDEEQVDELARSVQLARVPDEFAPIGMQVSHATRLVVVDAHGRVRGYYEGENPEGLKSAEARVRWLAESESR